MRELDDVMPAELIIHACDFIGVTPQDAYSKSREQRLMICRVLISYMLLYRGWSLPSVGREIKRDHSTVVYHRGVILNKSDTLIRKELYRFRSYLLKQDIRLPSIPQFKKSLRFRENINNK